MIRKMLGIYWKYRLDANNKEFKKLAKLRDDCIGHPDLVAQVQELIIQCQRLVLISEREYLKYTASIV